jgi:hypothetical protein
LDYSTDAQGYLSTRLVRELDLYGIDHASMKLQVVGREVSEALSVFADR